MNTSPILAAAAPSSLSTLGNASIAAPGDAPDFHQVLQQMNASVNSQGIPAANTTADTLPAQSASTSPLTNTTDSSDSATKLSDSNPSPDTKVFTEQDHVTDVHLSSFGSKTNRPASKHVATNTKSAEKETPAKESSSGKNKESAAVSPLAPFAVPTPVETQVTAIQDAPTLSSLQVDAPQDTTVGLNRFAAFMSHSLATAGHVSNLDQGTSTKSTSGSITESVSSKVTTSASLAVVTPSSGLDINRSAAATTQSTLATDVDEAFGVVNSGAPKSKASSAAPVASSADQTASPRATAAPNASVAPAAPSSLQTDIPSPNSAAPVVQASNLAQPTAPEIVAALISGKIPRAAAAPAANSTSAPGNSKAKSQPAIPAEKNTPSVAPATVNDAATSTPITPQNANPQFMGAQTTFIAANTTGSQTLVGSNAASAIGRAGGRSRQHSASLSNTTSSLSDKTISSQASSEHSSAVSSVTTITATPVQSALMQQAVTPDATHAAQSAAQSSPQVAAAMVAQSAPQPTAHTVAPTQREMQSNPIPDPPRMVDSGHLRVGQNSSELKISVQLPEVGKVEVRAVTSHDVTTAHITALRHDALPALSAERANLEQSLKSRDVILGSLNSSSQGQSDGQQRQQNFQSSARLFGGTSSNAAAVTTSTTAEASTTGILPDYSSISVRA